MKCAHVMSPVIQQCNLDDTIDVVARQMRDANVSFIAVCDEAGAIVGALSERDLVVNLVAESRPSHGTAASAVMSNDLVCCGSEDDLVVARELMGRYKKSRVVCVDEALRPIGFISGSEMLWTALMPRPLVQPTGIA